MEFDSRAEASISEPGMLGAGSNSTAGASGASSRGSDATVYLIHLKSFAGMGTAAIECVSGCSCSKRTLDGTWDTPASLQQMRKFAVRGAAPSLLGPTRSTACAHMPARQEESSCTSAVGTWCAWAGSSLHDLTPHACPQLLAEAAATTNCIRAPALQVSQHPRCRVRVTVRSRPGAVPQQGHKVALLGLLVSHFPLRMSMSQQGSVELMSQRTAGSTA